MRGAHFQIMEFPLQSSIERILLYITYMVVMESRFLKVHCLMSPTSFSSEANSIFRPEIDRGHNVNIPTGDQPSRWALIDKAVAKHNSKKKINVNSEGYVIPGVVGPETGFISPYGSLLSHRSERAVQSVRRNGGDSKPADKSASMPLADHSPGTSMAENPMAFNDWSQTPIGNETAPTETSLVLEGQTTIADGRSMAEKVLLGKRELWQWTQVMKTPPFTPMGDQYYGVNCCYKLPYICGVDGLCILNNSTECEHFCECALNDKISHCQRTIPRIKTVMRELETELIFGVATEKRIVVPPQLEKKMASLATATTFSNKPTESSSRSKEFTSSPKTHPTLVNTHTSITKPAMTTTVSTNEVSSSVHSVLPSISTRITNTQELGTTVTSKVDGISNDGVKLLNKTGHPVTPVLYTPSSSDTSDVLVSRRENATIDNCWQCEGTGGACVMGNDFQAHCVKELADGCVHFRCKHGSCISTDGSYSCECQEGWIGTFCDQPCPIQCGHNGYCARVGDSGATNTSLHNKDVIKLGSGKGGVACVCHWNFTGAKCEKKRKLIPQIQKVTISGGLINTWQLIVVLMSTTIFLASFVIILTYILWRRQWIPLRKLVFFFQDYEDDDGKQYDAFISYKGCPRDERFVLNHLYPKLEKELDFRLCLHFRDFPPGHPIANNIIYAIENSRRTIMILSPAYVKSEWCRMEYQKAQHEMLRLRHRLIPVVLEDIQDVPGVDRNLKTILETITYIKWPGEMENSFSRRSSHFWKLLELSMPKKKSDCAGSVTSSDKSSFTKPSMTNSSKSYFSQLADSFSRYSLTTDSSFLVNFLKRNQSPAHDSRMPCANHEIVSNDPSFTSQIISKSVTTREFIAPIYAPKGNSSHVKELNCLYDQMYLGCVTPDDASQSASSWTSDELSDESFNPHNHVFQGFKNSDANFTGGGNPKIRSAGDRMHSKSGTIQLNAINDMFVTQNANNRMM